MMSILLLAGGVGAVPVEEWNKTFGGTNEDLGYSVEQTSDGGYIIAGHNNGPINRNAWLIKTDAIGNQQWNNILGDENTIAYSVQETSDKGYIITELSKLIKTDADGRQQWSKLFSFVSYIGVGPSIEQTSDGGYVLAGRSPNDDIWLIKTYSDGSQQWINSFDNSGQDEAHSVHQTSDGGYIIAGQFGGTSYWSDFLIKTDINGKLQWNKHFGGWIAFSCLQTSDGGYIVAGVIGTSPYYDAWLIKTDSNGELIWKKTFGGIYNDEARSIQRTSDGGYIIAGVTNSYGSGKSDVWLIKTDSNGNQQWTKTIGGAGDDWANSVQQTADGGYIVVGWTNSYGAGGYDIWLIKVSSETPTTTPTQTPTQAPTTPAATTATPTTPTVTTPATTTPSIAIKRAQLQVTYDTSLRDNERITIKVVLKNMGNAIASNINLTIDHTPELEPIVISGSDKIGNTITWKGELKPNEEHISEYSIKGIRGQYVEIPLKATYFKISPEEKANTLGVSSAPLTPDEQEIILMIIRALLPKINSGFEAIITIMLLVFVTVILKYKKGS